MPMTSFYQLRQRIENDFCLNLMLSLFFGLYVYLNYFYEWPCGPMFTFWVCFLATVNVVFILTRIVLLRRLNQIETADVYMANYKLWRLLNSATYKFDTNGYQFILIIPSVFLAMFSLTKALCPKIILYAPFIMLFLSGCFIVLRSANVNYQNELDLIEMFKGISVDKMKLFHVIKWKEYREFVIYGENICPICYEEYEDESYLKQMDCQGQHVYHSQCIDKWILKSDKCPMCNLSIYKKIL
jgi:hypothetical protein